MFDCYSWSLSCFPILGLHNKSGLLLHPMRVIWSNVHVIGWRVAQAIISPTVFMASNLLEKGRCYAEPPKWSVCSNGDATRWRSVCGLGRITMYRRAEPNPEVRNFFLRQVWRFLMLLITQAFAGIIKMQAYVSCLETC